MKCKICDSESTFFGQCQFIHKYEVKYFKCTNCDFIQTENPYWLNEAYEKPIADSDAGLVTRNLNLAECSRRLIGQYFNPDGKFLDYGGGYGLFVRLMRDSGFDFRWSDKFCQNLFAQRFEAIDGDRYELVTAFGLLEHLINPLQEVTELLKLSDSLLFSTSLLPDDHPLPGTWWYYAPHEGQHISIYTYQSLSQISHQLGCNLYSDGQSVHLLTRKLLPDDIFLTLGLAQNMKPRPSLLSQDAAVFFNPHQTPPITITDTVQQPILTDIASLSIEKRNYKIIIDGVFFQLYKTGIARLWKSVLEEWSRDEFRNHVIVLDREGTCPIVPEIKYRSIPAFSYENVESDRELLQAICDEEKADLFISTYYTTPVSTPSVFMGYDMIPEVLGWDLNHPMWLNKHYAVQHASAYITISENTAKDLQTLFTINPTQITTALCGVAEQFKVASHFEVMQFRNRFNIHKPYFLMVGPSRGYKNADLFLNGLSNLCSRSGFDVVCTGSSAASFSAEARQILPDVTFHPLFLEDWELRSAYTGALALVYPSKYEGFGLPVVEAMKCGCPVITTPNASLPEVAGNAAIYVNDDDVESMTSALTEVQNLRIRQLQVQEGYHQASKFTWTTMAQKIKNCLTTKIDTTYQPTSHQVLVLFNWNQDEESLLNDILKFLEIIYSSIEIHVSHRFYIETTGIRMEDADLLLSSGMMEFLMQHESAMPENIEVQLIEPLTIQNSQDYQFNSQICFEAEGKYLPLATTLPRFGAPST